MRAVHAAGLPVRFLTNTTSRTQAEICEALVSAGFEADPAEVLTATAATASHLRAHHPGARCLLLNSGDVSDDLAGVTLVGDGAPVDDVDVVVLGGAGPEFSYEALNQALQCLLAGAAFVAMHRNVAWRTADGMQLDTGAYVCGCSSEAEHQLPKLRTRVRFPSPALGVPLGPRRADAGVLGAALAERDPGSWSTTSRSSPRTSRSSPPSGAATVSPRPPTGWCSTCPTRPAPPATCPAG
jgi:hypothetical protein